MWIWAHRLHLLPDVHEVDDRGCDFKERIVMLYMEPVFMNITILRIMYNLPTNYNQFITIINHYKAPKCTLINF